MTKKKNATKERYEDDEDLVGAAHDEDDGDEVEVSRAKKGHNIRGGEADARLKAILDRIERLEEDRAATAQDIKEVYLEAKGNGYDAKIIRKIIKIRKMDAEKRREEDALLEIYLVAVGMD